MENASAYIKGIRDDNIKSYYLRTRAYYSETDTSYIKTILIIALDKYYKKGKKRTDSAEFLILQDKFLEYLIYEYYKHLKANVTKTNGGKQNSRVRRSKKHKRKNARKSRRYSR